MVAAVLLLVTGCAQTVTGAAGPVAGAKQTAAALPLDADEQALAAVFATVRTWDLCAVHDVQAAASVTGYTPDELLPSIGLDTCRLRLKQPDGVSEWELTFSIATVQPVDGAAPIALGATQLQQTGYSSEATCSYSYPIGPDGDRPWGIEVTSYNVSANRPPCDVARDYVNAVGQRLVSPPLRTQGRTSPAPALGGTDPCALAAELVPVLADGAPVDLAESRANLSGPYGCSIGVRIGEGAADLTDVWAAVELSVASEPLKGAVVAGRPAAHMSLGSDCILTFQSSDFTVQGNPGFQPTYETAKITASCDQVQRVAEAAAQALGTPAAPITPVGGALALGDLDPPPSPEQVGAPFDPCTIVGWDGYPQELRPTQPKIAAAMPVTPQSGYSVGCSFNTGPMFSSLVWGTPQGAFSADPAARPGAAAAQFSGKPGVEQRGTLERGEPLCYSAVQLATGIAAMSTVLPSGDPCAVNRPILEQVAARVP
ncbi:hypothetical protein GCM10009609_18020 [Pseudonocardia aurantiaca]